MNLVDFIQMFHHLSESKFSPFFYNFTSVGVLLEDTDDDEICTNNCSYKNN